MASDRKKWVKDISIEILEKDSQGKKQHWLTLPPRSSARVHPQYRRCMSYNISMNLFGPDEFDKDDDSPTTFEDYYEGRIEDVMAKFARRFRETIPVEPVSKPDIDEKERLLESTISLAAGTIDAAAIYASQLGDLRIKALYVKELFNKDQARLAGFLSVLHPLVKICPWICVPFMNYSWTVIDDPKAPRPDEAAYKAHLYGATNPTLPRNSPASPQNPLGGPTMDIHLLDYENFTYFDTTGNTQLQRTYKLTRLFAMAWNFLDPVDIVERHKGRSGTLPFGVEDDPDGFEEFEGKRIKSSGNGYKCVGGICQANNASSFCVSTSCP